MPQVFRIKRQDEDGLPNVSRTANGLGVRLGNDIDVDPMGQVVVNGKGMSVNPNWKDAPLFRIPKRLRHLMPGAVGSNDNACFRFGTGKFERGIFAERLTLEPDREGHGVVAPDSSMPLAVYEAALIATRSGWESYEKSS